MTSAEKKAREYIEDIKRLNKKYYPNTKPLIDPDDMLNEFIKNFEEQEKEVERIKRRLNVQNS